MPPALSFAWAGDRTRMPRVSQFPGNASLLAASIGALASRYELSTVDSPLLARIGTEAILVFAKAR